MSFGPALLGRGKYLRPTGVVGRPTTFGSRNIGIQIIGLREALLIPEELRAAYEMMMERLRESLQTMARSEVPGGPIGKLAFQVHARRLAHDRIVIGTVGSQFARALDRGFTSTAKTGKALRFEEDGTVFFRKRVRVAGRHFYAKWIESAPPIVEAVYEASFYNIKDLMVG